MVIKRAFVFVIVGAFSGGVLGALGGMIGGIYSRHNSPENRLIEIEFESALQELHYLLDGIASNMILAALLGIVTAVLVNAFAAILRPLWNVFLVSTITFLFAGWTLFYVGETIVGEPGGMIGGGLFGIIGGFMGRYLVNKFCPKRGSHLEKNDDTDDVLEGRNLIPDNDIESSEPKELGTKWLSFWNYVYLPIILILIAFYIIQSISLILSEEFLFYLRPSVIFGGLVTFVIFTIVRLHLRKAWAWKSNWVFIVIPLIPFTVEMFLTPSDWLVNLIYFVVLLIIWVCPNYIYWKKRRHLFT